MDPFHERLARVALDTAARYGFCLAGGYAVQAHGFVERVSKDVDLFTTMAAAGDFPTAQAAVVAGLRADGLEVAVEREGPTFARLAVADPVGGRSSTLELGVDWRAYPPVQLAIGPVLHPVDAAANRRLVLDLDASTVVITTCTPSASPRPLGEERPWQPSAGPTTCGERSLSA